MTQAPGMFRRWMSFVAWVALAGCSQEAPQYPDQALLLCNSASDCPTDWECLPCPEGTEGCESDQSICSPVVDKVCAIAELVRTVVLWMPYAYIFSLSESD